MPRKSTIRLKNLFLAAYQAANFNIVQACRDVGIGRETYYNWMRDDPQFKELVDASFEDLISICEGHLYTSARAGDRETIKYLLEHKAADRGWSQKVMHEGNVKLEVIRRVITGKAQESDGSHTDG